MYPDPEVMSVPDPENASDFLKICCHLHLFQVPLVLQTVTSSTASHSDDRLGSFSRLDPKTTPLGSLDEPSISGSQSPSPRPVPTPRV